MTRGETEMATQGDSTIGACKLRVNRTASLDLTTSWQRIDFNGTSTLNQNTYPRGADGIQTLRWEASTKLFRFATSKATGQLMPQYRFDNYVQVSSTSAALAAAGVTLAKLATVGVAAVQLRFVIPSPTPFYFPFPDTSKALDVCDAGFVPVRNSVTSLTVTANGDMQKYGLGVDMRLSNTVVGTSTLTDCNLLIHGR